MEYRSERQIMPNTPGRTHTHDRTTYGNNLPTDGTHYNRFERQNAPAAKAFRNTIDGQYLPNTMVNYDRFDDKNMSASQTHRNTFDSQNLPRDNAHYNRLDAQNLPKDKTHYNRLDGQNLPIDKTHYNRLDGQNLPRDEAYYKRLDGQNLPRDEAHYNRLDGQNLPRDEAHYNRLDGRKLPRDDAHYNRLDINPHNIINGLYEPVDQAYQHSQLQWNGMAPSYSNSLMREGHSPTSISPTNQRFDLVVEEPAADYNVDVSDKQEVVGNGNVGHFTQNRKDISSSVQRGRHSPQVMIELQPTLGSSANGDAQTQIKRRSTVQQQLSNGSSFMQHPKTIGRGSGTDTDDSLSLQSLNFNDLKETRRLLSTIRVKTLKRKSLSLVRKKSSSLRNKENDGDSGSEDEYGLPSMRRRMKTLTEKLYLAKQQRSTTQVARKYREALTSVPSARLLLYTQGFTKRFKSVNERLSDAWSRVNFFSKQFKEIEGQFGVSTTTYFRFTRWLVKVNFLVFFLFLCFIYIPQLTHLSGLLGNSSALSNSTDEYAKKMIDCSASYAEYISNVSSWQPGWDTFLEVAQGTGILENTMLFYGYYTNLTLWITDGSFQTTYNMGLAYLLTVGFSFLIVFIMIVKNSSKTIQETVMDFDHQAFPQYSCAVFSGWDFCIRDAKMAAFKHKIILDELKATLKEVELRRLRENRTTKEKVELFFKRLVIHLVVIALLGGSFYAIYVATDFLLETSTDKYSGVELLLVNYLPSIVISALNFIVPEIFMFLSKFEQYSPIFATNLTIVRAVFLRLASVWVLIVSLYYRLFGKNYEERFTCEVEGPDKTSNQTCCGNRLWQSDKEPVKCWETYVGQQFYKLGVLDFVSVVLVIFLIKIPRSLIFKNLKGKLWIIDKIGKSTFDLPLQVLDIVYSQTVCWLGMFFTPLLPAITFVKVFLFFFLKKLELTNTAQSSQNVSRASRSYSFFQIVLLVSFIVISCLLGYMIGNLQPSMSCGPFRLYSSENFVMFDVVSNEVNSWPQEPKNIIGYFGTVAFFIPAFVVLLLAIYYFSAVAVGYKKMEELLKQQLKSEAQDKQYLLARVEEIHRRGQLNF